MLLSGSVHASFLASRSRALERAIRAHAAPRGARTQWADNCSSAADRVCLAQEGGADVPELVGEQPGVTPRCWVARLPLVHEGSVAGRLSEDAEVQLLVELGELAIGGSSEQLVGDVHEHAVVAGRVIGEGWT
jgi:hypothetical protein